MQERRTASAPVTPLNPPTPLSPPLSQPQRLSIIVDEPTAPGHSRTVSAGDYFSLPRVPPQRSLARVPRHTRSSGRMLPVRQPSSPLITELRLHQHRPDVTFDSFLAPHASGKGEAFRGADNAKKDKQSGDGAPDDAVPRELDISRRWSKHISRVPSMPTLRSKWSRGSLLYTPPETPLSE